MQGLAATICRAGPVLEALRPGARCPKRTQRPRRGAEGTISQHAGGQQGGTNLGLTSGLGHRQSGGPDTNGGTVELPGGTLSPEPWARHCMEILATQISPTRSRWPSNSAPLRGGWEALTWTAGPVDSATVQSSSDGGQDLCRRHGGTSSRSCSRWGTGHIPSRRICWRISGRSWR